MAAVAARYGELKALNVEVIAISADSIFSHWMFKKTSPSVKNLPYPMAADPNGEVGRAYGVYKEESGQHQRGRFIVDPNGIVRAVEIIYPPVARSVDELIRQIKAMQAVDANPGMAAPAGWKPGGALIHTGKDYIGVY